MKSLKWMLLVLTIVLFSSCIDFDEDEGCRDTNCANYTSQTSAQAAFNADPTCRNDLDRDNDGIACEEPGNSVKTCASTSKCGCSGKNKSPCEADPCCRWTVGSGCGCS